jgi:hypothetical protein
LAYQDICAENSSVEALVRAVRISGKLEPLVT